MPYSSGGSAGGSSTITIGTTIVSGGVDGQLLYNNGGVVGGFGEYDDTGAGDATFTFRKTTDAAGQQFFRVGATMPAVITANFNGASFSITGAGSSAFTVTALNSNLLAGYTGASQTRTHHMVNSSSGTAAALNTGNVGANASAGGVTTGFNMGGHFTADSSTTLNAALVSRCISAAGSPLNFGIIAKALNATVNVAGYFALDNATTAPSVTTAALICDNAAQAFPSFIARDNGTPVFTIGDGGTTTFTGAQLGGNGAAATPTYSFSNATTTGLYWHTNGVLVVSTSAIDQIAVSNTQAGASSGGLLIKSTGVLAWSSSGTITAAGGDTFLTRSAAATLQFGSADSATPTAQIIRAMGSRGGTDSNVAGASLTAYSGLGTGTAAVSELVFRTGVVQASGTTQHTLTDAAKITAGGLQNTKGDKFLSADHTNATATPTNLTDLTTTLVSGRKYAFRMYLMCSQSVAADGIRIDFEGGSATATNFRANVLIFDGTTLDTHTSVTALATDVTSTDVGTTVLVQATGSFEPSAAGTFIPRVGLEAASTGVITTFRGSHISVWDMA